MTEITPKVAAMDRQALLGIYLNDHLAGATGGLELARRLAGAHRETAMGDALQRIAAEIEEDRAALMEMMSTLGVSIRQYKIYLGWLGERLARVKLNGRLFNRSPLSTLHELETMMLGVEGKAAIWRVLRVLADQSDRRLDSAKLDELLSRARQQADTLETFRINTAKGLLQG